MQTGCSVVPSPNSLEELERDIISLVKGLAAEARLALYPEAQSHEWPDGLPPRTRRIARELWEIRERLRGLKER